MKKLYLASLFLAGSCLFAQIGVGIRIGPPPPPRVVAVQPVSPGPDYTWVAGYWYPVDGRYVWHDGYWTRGPYVGAHWVGPHYDGGLYVNGYWDGPHGRFEHNHDWDRDRDRDYNRYH
jgi:hypothetical protein